MKELIDNLHYLKFNFTAENIEKILMVHYYSKYIHHQVNIKVVKCQLCRVTF